MTKLLKLTGMQTYIGVLTKTGEGSESAVVRKGEVVRWDDKDAASAATGSNIDREGQPVPYFTDVTDTFNGEPDHDFSKKKEVKKAAEPDKKPAANTTASTGDGEDEGEGGDEGGEGDEGGDEDKDKPADPLNKTTSPAKAGPRTQRVAAKKS